MVKVIDKIDSPILCVAGLYLQFAVILPVNPLLYFCRNSSYNHGNRRPGSYSQIYLASEHREEGYKGESCSGKCRIRIFGTSEALQSSGTPVNGEQTTGIVGIDNEGVECAARYVIILGFRARYQH